MDIGNIYAPFRKGEEWLNIPFVAVPRSASDKPVTYIPGKSLLTVISQKYYGNPYMGKLIMAANPELGSDEFSIEEEVTLRVPFPLELALQSYREALENYIKH